MGSHGTASGPRQGQNHGDSRRSLRLDATDSARILACEDDDALISVAAEIEERRDTHRLCEPDSFRDALHRCLTDGEPAFGNGDFPLSHAVLGGVPLHKSGGYIVCHVTAGQVPAVAHALEPLDGEWLRERHATLTFDACQGTADAEDIAYTQAFPPGLKQFHGAAAREGQQ
ncbi:DUF1877 family protein [Actinacidiphila glaucinigra]|uniref:DUF1877 family protein n=1 Tax=Actinacidiphila glaucinigra TaxID=235986 RepID=UPI0036EF05CC